MSSDYTPPRTVWRTLKGKPYFTVSPVGSTQGFPANNGADFGPDTPGTTTSGIKEAINASPTYLNPYTNRYVPVANIKLLPGSFLGTSAIPLYCDWYVNIEGLGPIAQNDNTNFSAISHAASNLNWTSPEGVIQTLSPFPAGTGSSRTNGYVRLANFSAYNNALANNTLSYQQSTQAEANYCDVVLWGQEGTTGSAQIPQTTILDNFRMYDTYTAANGGAGNGAISIVSNGLEEIYYLSNLDVFGSTVNHNVVTLQGLNHLWLDTITIFGDNNGAGANGWGLYMYYPGGRWFMGSVHLQGLFQNLMITDNPSSLVLPIHQLNLELSTPTLAPLRGFQIPIYQPLTIDEVSIEPGTYNPFSASNGIGTPSGFTPALFRVGKDLTGVFSHGFAITTPSVPASGTAQANTNPFPVRVYITGAGTTTAYTITDPAGNAETFSLALAAGQEITLDPGASITITYTVAPTWKWYGQ